MLTSNIVNLSNSFVSTLDHLPCDVVRSLWLIQFLSLRVDQYMNQLDRLLKDSDLNDPEVVEKVVRFRNLACKYSKEVVAESQHLKDKLDNHQDYLINDSLCMERLKQLKINEQNNTRASFEQFKKQFLKEHGLREGDVHPKTQHPVDKRESLKIHISLPKQKFKSTTATKTNRKVQNGKQKSKVAKPSKRIIASPPTLPSPIPPPTPPAEDVYCLCRGPGLGKMVACDNPGCKYEWFHYKCVNLTRAPEGKWICPECSAVRLRKKKRRGKRW
ncbi:BA75_03505T0 [Komagataella pastoris]|uniref:BA75_03505T0 n=1 Tax=Komagataella pastoris TaxID=4922 RepID=A0A1B2JF32_PICPA|nr:BA75_03505T0 [Komagataella pastoris]